MASEIEPRKKSKSVGRKLNTKGCCFLCLAVIDFKTEEMAEGDNRNEKGATATNYDSSVSLSLLNRHLSVNLEKLSEAQSSPIFLKESDDGLSSTLTKEAAEDAHVTLCQPCREILKKFTKLFLSLEKIQMEMDYWQGRIYQQILNASKMPELVQNYSKRMTSEPETLLQLAFVDRYRKEILKKSLQESKRRPEANVELVRLKKSQVKSAKTRTLPSAAPRPVFARTAADIEEPQIHHILKFQNDEDHDVEHEDAVEQTPPYSPPPQSPTPPLSKMLASLVTEKKTCNGVNKPRTVRTESDIKTVLDSKTGKYGCTKCKKEFTSGQTARFHYDAVHLQRKWKCDICTISVFSYQKLLTEHQKTCRDSLQQRLSALKAKQNDPRYKFPCSTCKKKFKEHNQMVTHNRLVHLKERNHACDLCNKTFPIARDLKRHKNAVHLGITFKCRSCSKEFKYKINQQRHERSCDKKSVISKIKNSCCLHSTRTVD